MLLQPLVNKLYELRLESMAKALQEQMESDQYDNPSEITKTMPVFYIKTMPTSK
jgi:hypothetical protein